MRGTTGAAAELIKVVLKNFDVLAGYASVMEMENKSMNNDQQWLTYWILYSMITLFELSFAKFIEWIPIWSYVKFILTCWLVIPYFNGAALVYQHYVKPTFAYRGQSFDFSSHVPWKKGIFGKRKPDDILTAVEKYIKENGTEGLEKLIHRTDRNTHYGDMCYTDYYNEDNTWNTGYGNMCYTDYNEEDTWNTGYGNMCHTDYNENDTRYGDMYYTDYNEDYTYRSFGD